MSVQRARCYGVKISTNNLTCMDNNIIAILTPDTPRSVVHKGTEVNFSRTTSKKQKTSVLDVVMLIKTQFAIIARSWTFRFEGLCAGPGSDLLRFRSLNEQSWFGCWFKGCKLQIRNDWFWCEQTESSTRNNTPMQEG